MKIFELRSLCNELLAELNESMGKRNIIKFGIDIQLPESFYGRPVPLSDTIRSLTDYLSGKLINGIINIEITHHANMEALVMLHVQITGRGSSRINGTAKCELDAIAKNTGFKITHKMLEDQITFEFIHNLKTATPSGTVADLPFQNKKILLVEDNEINALVFLSFLEEWGCETTTAVNGVEAVSQVHSSLFPFDAILMDIHMPVLNGIEAIKKIRDFNSTIPIIALTASTRDEDFREATEAGANDFLLKPVSSTQLYQALSRYL